MYMYIRMYTYLDISFETLAKTPDRWTISEKYIAYTCTLVLLKLNAS